MTFSAHKLTEEEIADAMEIYDSQLRPLIDELLARTEHLGLPTIVNVLVANKTAEDPETGEIHREGFSHLSSWGRDDDPLELVIAHIALSNFFDFEHLREVIMQPPKVIRAYHRLILKLRGLGIDRWSAARMQYSEEALLEMLKVPVSPSELH